MRPGHDFTRVITPRFQNGIAPPLSTPRDRYIYYADVADVPESQAVNIRNRSWRDLEAAEEAATEESDPSAETIEPAVGEPVAEELAPAEDPVAEAAPEPEIAEAVTEPQGDETAA